MTKYILFQLFIVCIAFTAQAQETRKPQQMPMRTSDPSLRQTVMIQPALPVKSGGDIVRQQKSVQTATLPLKSGESAQQSKLLEPAVVPIRKTNPAAPAAAGGAQNKATKDKPAVTLPSSLSIKEAREQPKQ
ncbi:MAG: hypothetical protein J0H74_00795 [Chitinophagaceae bacterium]|nr:hypothetical protein [Chitinophagaceae bacterium]